MRCIMVLRRVQDRGRRTDKLPINCRPRADGRRLEGLAWTMHGCRMRAMPSVPPPSDFLVLRRKARFSGWLGLSWRLAVMAGLLGTLILVHWIEREGLHDNYDDKVSLLDVIYFTM